MPAVDVFYKSTLLVSLLCAHRWIGLFSHLLSAYVYGSIIDLFDVESAFFKANLPPGIQRSPRAAQLILQMPGPAQAVSELNYRQNDGYRTL